MRFLKTIRRIACMALIFAFSLSTCVYAENRQNREYEAIKPFSGILWDGDYSSDDPIDGLKDLFTIFTGYSEKRKPRGESEIRVTALYTFPPLVWAKTLMARVIDHPDFTFAYELPLARRMFLNSLFVFSDVRSSSLMGQKLWKDLCAEETFITAIKENMDGKDSATFVYMTESQDLSYSVAHIQVKCRRMAASEEGERILVECSDYYDFEPTEYVTYLDDLGNIINEIGWQGYRLRILNPYSVYAMGVLTIR